MLSAATSGGRAPEVGVEAKLQGRNRLVSFTPEMRQPSYNEGRGHCRPCGTGFSFMVPTNNARTDDLYCPNCGDRIIRPVDSAEGVSTTEAPTDPSTVARQ
jgi:DNA-directed RNA polymerase subunit RPC12/RpoP